MSVAEEILVLIKHYGCCRRNIGAHQILSKTGKRPWLHKRAGAVQK